MLLQRRDCSDPDLTVIILGSNTTFFYSLQNCTELNMCIIAR